MTGELFVKAKYINCIQEKTKWYWYKKQQQQLIIVPTCTIVHPRLSIMIVKYVHDINKIVRNRNQAKKASQINPICLTYSYHNIFLNRLNLDTKLSLKEILVLRITNNKLLLCF